MLQTSVMVLMQITETKNEKFRIEICVLHYRVENVVHALQCLKTVETAMR